MAFCIIDVGDVGLLVLRLKMHFIYVHNLNYKPVIRLFEQGFDRKDPNTTSKTPGAPQISRCQCYVVSAAWPGQSLGCDRSLSLCFHRPGQVSPRSPRMRRADLSLSLPGASHFYSSSASPDLIAHSFEAAISSPALHWDGFTRL